MDILIAWRTGYRGFGQTLLAEMLVLSDVVVESIPPEITRAQLREVKEEIKEEAAITDLEVMMEDTDPHQEKIESVLVKALYQYYKENYKEYPELHKAVTGAGVTPEIVMELLAPSGTGCEDGPHPWHGTVHDHDPGKEPEYPCGEHPDE